MSAVVTEPVTVAELLEQLGNIPAERVRLRLLPARQPRPTCLLSTITRIG